MGGGSIGSIRSGTNTSFIIEMINLPEEYSNEDHECREYPDDKDPLVENVVQGEAHVGGQLLKAAHVFLHLEQVTVAQYSKGHCIF